MYLHGDLPLLFEGLAHGLPALTILLTTITCPLPPPLYTVTPHTLTDLFFCPVKLKESNILIFNVFCLVSISSQRAEIFVIWYPQGLKEYLGRVDLK